MAIHFWWLGGHAGEDFATICVRSTTNGQVSVVCNGQTFTGDTIDTSVRDGVGRVVVTGLQPGRRYPFTLSVGGDSTSRCANGDKAYLKTMPAAGSRYNVLEVSCYEQMHTSTSGSHKAHGVPMWLVRALNETNPAFAAMIGDGQYFDRPMNYSAGAQAYGGQAPVEVSSANRTNSANFRAWILSMLLMPAILYIIQRVPTVFMGDDHEKINDFCLKRNIFGTGLHSTYTSYYQGCVELYQAAVAEAWDYYCGYGNPPNTDAGIDSDALFFARYFRFTVGDTEYFVIDTSTYLDDYNAADGPTKTLLGATQKTWLKTAISNSTATFKVVVSGKKLFEVGSAEGNANTFMDFPDERDELVDYISQVTTTCWASGDRHAPDGFLIPRSSLSTYLLDMCACPVGASPTRATPDGQTHDNYLSYLCKGQNSNSYATQYCCYGLIEINGAANPAYMRPSIVNAMGRTMMGWRIEEGSNEPVSPKMFSI